MTITDTFVTCHGEKDAQVTFHGRTRMDITLLRDQQHSGNNEERKRGKWRPHERAQPDTSGTAGRMNERSKERM